MTGTSASPKSQWQQRPARRPSRAPLSRCELGAALPGNGRPPPPSTILPASWQRNGVPNSQRLAQPDGHTYDATCSTEHSPEEEEGSSIIGDQECPYSDAPDHRPRPIANGRMAKRWSFLIPRAFHEQLSHVLEGPRKSCFPEFWSKLLQNLGKLAF